MTSLARYRFTAHYLDDEGQVLAREDSDRTIDHDDRIAEAERMRLEHPKADYIDFIEIF